VEHAPITKIASPQHLPENIDNKHVEYQNRIQL